MNGPDAKAAYDRYEVPGPGRVVFQAAFANVNPRAVVEYSEYPGRPHFTAGAHGLEEVADHALDWSIRHAGAAP
jgi:hypothetical protein